MPGGQLNKYGICASIRRSIRDQTMTDKDKPAPKPVNIQDSHRPTVEKSYRPSTGEEQGSHTPTTSQGGNNTPPMPKKK
jgi:hypothetical protein